MLQICLNKTLNLRSSEKHLTIKPLMGIYLSPSVGKHLLNPLWANTFASCRQINPFWGKYLSPCGLYFQKTVNNATNLSLPSRQTSPKPLVGKHLNSMRAQKPPSGGKYLSPRGHQNPSHQVPMPQSSLCLPGSDFFLSAASA
jgi:hypothetical protein